MNFINKTHLSPVEDFDKVPRDCGAPKRRRRSKCFYWVSPAKNFLLDLVFPRYCLGCEQEIESKQTSQICDVCFEKIVLNSGIQCHLCGLRNPRGTCKNCRKKTLIRGLFFPAHYKDPILREMIQSFKYRSIESLKIPLAELIINYLRKENLIDEFSGSVIVPVPLTLKRKLARGFNQSELLAKEIGGHLNCPVINLLKRTKFNTPQVEIPDWQKRKENVSGVFVLAPNINNIGFGNLYNKVILVDDVATSGATLEEAASVLKQAGIKEIYGLVAAKG